MSIKSPRQPVTKTGRAHQGKRLIKKSRKAAAENDRMSCSSGVVPGRPAITKENVSKLT